MLVVDGEEEQREGEDERCKMDVFQCLSAVAVERQSVAVLLCVGGLMSGAGETEREGGNEEDKKGAGRSQRMWTKSCEMGKGRRVERIER